MSKEQRQIKFRAWDKRFNRMDFGGGDLLLRINTEDFSEPMLFTGLFDKNGVEIYRGDVIRIQYPYRSTQTHMGDNIPNGSYTEPMEPEIRVIDDVVVWSVGQFALQENPDRPLGSWFYHYENERDLQEAVNFNSRRDDWSGDDGELQYLLEKYGKKNIAELLEFVSGVEVVGNVYETPEYKDWSNE